MQEKYVYVSESGEKIEFNTTNCRTILGITMKTVKRYAKISNSTSINDIIQKYNEDRKSEEEKIDVESELKLDREIKSNLYKVNIDGQEKEVSISELFKIARGRNDNLRDEYILIYLKRIIKEGLIRKVDLLDEFVARYEAATTDTKPKYLYKNVEGEFVLTRINTILKDYKTKNPDSNISFDYLAAILERCASDPSIPEQQVVEKALEYYEQNKKVTKTFLYKKDDGQYEEMPISAIKEEWKKLGFDVKKHETVSKYLEMASKIKGIKPEEIVEQAFKIMQDSLGKYDYEMTDGTVKKLSFREIANEEKKKGNTMKTATLINNFKKAREESADEDISEVELIKRAIERTLKNERKKYLYPNENGDLVELYYTEIARLANIDRSVLARAIKLLNEENVDSSDSQKFIQEAIDKAKSLNVRKKANNYKPSKKYRYIDENGDIQEITVAKINEKIREKGTKVLVETLQRALDKILSSDESISLDKAVEKALIIIEASKLKKTKPQKRNFAELQKSELSIILGITIEDVNELFERFESEDGTLDEEAFAEYYDDMLKNTQNIEKRKQKFRSFTMPDGKTLKRYCEENSYNYDVIIGNLERIERITGKIDLMASIEHYKNEGQKGPTRYKFTTYDILLKHVALQLGINFDDAVYRMRTYNWPLKIALEETLISHELSDFDFVKSTIVKMQYSQDDDEIAEIFQKFKELSSPEEKKKMNDIFEKTQKVVNTIRYINFTSKLAERNITSEDLQRKSATAVGINFDDYKEFMTEYKEFFEGEPGYLKAPIKRKQNQEEETEK